MDILKRHKKTWTTYAIATVVLILIAAALIYFSISDLGIEDKSTQATPKLATLKSGEYGHVAVDGFYGPFAYDDRNKVYYYLTVLDNGDMLIVDLSSTNNNLWQTYTVDEKAFKEAQPIRVEGRVRKVNAELKSFAKPAYNKAGYKGILPDDAPVLQTYLSTTNKSAAPPWLFVLAVLAAIFAIAMLISAVVNSRRLKSAKALLAEKYPHHDDFTFLDERKDLDIPSRRLFVKDGMLISERGGLVVTDLNDVGWMHYQRISSRYGSQPYLFVYSKSKKNKRKAMLLSGRIKDAETDLQPLFEYVRQNYPSILIGKSKENKQLYRSRFE